MLIYNVVWHHQPLWSITLPQGWQLTVAFCTNHFSKVLDYFDGFQIFQSYSPKAEYFEIYSQEWVRFIKVNIIAYERAACLKLELYGTLKDSTNGKSDRWDTGGSCISRFNGVWDNLG